jgi:adenylylsulfate reductase subunit A
VKSSKHANFYRQVSSYHHDSSNQASEFPHGTKYAEPHTQKYGDYNRMMTVNGLFGAGDAVGGTPHAFSSGSFTEGRLSAKAACKYIDDGKAEGIGISQKQIDDRKAEIYKPLETYTVGRNEIVGGTVSPSYILPMPGLQRLQKLMDEYAGGVTVQYMTNDKLLNMGLHKLKILEEDLEKVGAEDVHQLLRAWELKHRHRTSECVVQHTLFREETRWPNISSSVFSVIFIFFIFS